MNLSELRYHATTKNIDETEILLSVVLTNCGILFQGEDLKSIPEDELDLRISSLESALKRHDMEPKYYWKTQFSLIDKL